MADPLSRAGERYATAEILAYVGRLHAAEDSALQTAARAAELDGLPPIQVGPSEGRLLGLLLRLAGAKRVVEVGTLAGYSSVWMARALPEGGHLWSLEHDPHHAAVARRNLAAAGLSDRVTVLEGPAIDVLPSLEAHGPFDAVFLDADKGNYDRYGAWAETNLRRGGVLLADNVYFFGRLLGDERDAQAMRSFHEAAARSFETVCIPTPDGLLLGIKR